MTSTIRERRIVRLLRILETLQTGSLMTAGELADYTNVCSRTIFRDLRLLRSAGVTIRFERSLGGTEAESGEMAEAIGAYRLVPRDGLTVVPRLEPDELLILTVAAQISSLTRLPGCGHRLRQATAKLMAEAPPELMRGMQRIMQTMEVDRGLPHYSLNTLQTLDHVIQAIHRRRTLDVVLHDPGMNTIGQTRLALYQVDVTPDEWVLMGRSTLHRGVTRIDAGHIRSARLTDEIYAVPRRYQAG